METALKIRIREGRCVGAGQCESFAPKLFRQDDDTGLVIVLIENPSAEDRALAESAVQACPTKAIYLED